MRSLLGDSIIRVDLENQNKINIEIPTSVSNSAVCEKSATQSRSKKIRIETDYEISFEKEILTAHKITFQNLIS